MDWHDKQFIGIRRVRLLARLREEGLEKKFLLYAKRGKLEKAQNLALQMIEKYGQDLEGKDG